MKPTKRAIDSGTPESSQHRKVVAVPAPGRPGKIHLKVVDQTELDRLLDRKEITQDEWSTGDQVYRILYKAGMLGALKSALGQSARSGDPQSISDRRSDAVSIIADLIVHLDKACGRDARMFFFNVLSLDSPVKTKRLVNTVRHCLSEVDRAFS